jgi:hypothetical protein
MELDINRHKKNTPQYRRRIIVSELMTILDSTICGSHKQIKTTSCDLASYSLWSLRGRRKGIRQSQCGHCNDQFCLNHLVFIIFVSGKCDVKV